MIVPPLRLEGESRIEIGDDVYIGSDCWLQVLDGGSTAGISIGDGSSLAGHCVISAAQSVQLGTRVLLARNVYIADHSHAFEDTQQAVLDQGVVRCEPVRIDSGAWIGENAFIGPGVSIGRGAVVGANAVVLSDVPPFTVAVGVPARVVRTFGG